MPMSDYNRFQSYKNYVIRTGGKEELFDLVYIQQIINDIIQNGDPVLQSIGKSTFYFKDANEDGTFDICGRMDGPNVSLVYVMSYCDDSNADHYLMLHRYEVVDHHEGNYIVRDGISHKDIILNHDGDVVEEIEYPMIGSDTQSKGLLSFMNEKQIIKKMI